MNDTPDHIKKKQLEIWLSKSPVERLRQSMIDNDALMQFWRKANSSLQAPEQKAESLADQEKLFPVNSNYKPIRFAGLECCAANLIGLSGSPPSNYLLIIKSAKLTNLFSH